MSTTLTESLLQEKAAPSGEPTTVEKLRGLPWSIAGDTTNTIFTQLIFFGPIFILFLDKLGLNKTEIGSLLSLVPFAAVLAIWIAPFAVRFGYKRTFIIFFGLRKVITAGLLLTPWVTARFGVGAASLFVALITGGFAFCKAVSDTAAYPWIQEFVPDSVRGKYYATSNLFCTIANFLVVIIAGFVIEASRGLTGFMILIAVGVVAGLVSAWTYLFVPGGGQRTDATPVKMANVLAVWRDRNFRSYMLGVGLIIVGFVPLLSFLPLFMRQVVGLSESNVVRLPTGALAGGLLAGYFWGWAADRYGSKPVMMSGLSLRLLLPVFWFLLPQHSPWSLPLALGIAVLQGIADMGWVIGSARLLFVNVVPSRHSIEYLSLYYALAGIISGSSQVLGGWALDRMSGFQLTSGIVHLDQYSLLMASAVLSTLGGMTFFRRVRGDSGVSTGQFAGLFVQGNPLRAFASMIGYQRAQDERSTVFMTERLAWSQSHLLIDELLDALGDPRFNVRYEAILAIAGMQPDPRLTNALIAILQGKSPALSVIAAWALGRSGDVGALPALRQGLDASYKSIQSHCARSLATLGDRQSIPTLLARLQSESDYGLRVAYASALGRLQANEASEMLLNLLAEADDESIQLELALAVARTLGEEHSFIQLLRHARQGDGVALAEALLSLREKISRLVKADRYTLAALDKGCEWFACNNFSAGSAQLHQILARLPLDQLPVTSANVLRACRAQLTSTSETELAYLLLTLYTLEIIGNNQ